MVAYAAAGTRRVWELRSEFLSPRYTTSWDELLIARDLPRRISGFPLIRQINLALILFEKMSDPNYYDTQIWRGYSVSSR
jgi:hypothetical protein